MTLRDATQNDESRSSTSVETSALLEFSRLLNELDDPEAIYGNVLLSLMGKMGLAAAGVAVPDADGSMRIEIAKGSMSRLAGTSFAWPSTPHGGIHERSVLEPSGPLTDAGVERLMPISFGDDLFAVILLGRSLLGRPFGSGEESYALLVGGMAAIALEGCRVRSSLRESNRRLERRVHRLRSLFEAGREFSTILDPDGILRLLGFSLMGEMAISRYAVALRDGEGFKIVLNRFRDPIPVTLLDEVATWGPKGLEHDDEGVEGLLRSRGIRASVPMEAQGTTRGILLVGDRLRSQLIDTEDLEYLFSLGNLAIGALENMRLVQEIIIKQRLEEDLRIAAEIQQGLLPAALPAPAGYEFAARTIPTHQVGGDTYDALELPDGSILVAIADVSGKGTPASLLMANVQAAVRSLAELCLPLNDLVARVNDLLYRNTAADKFVTAFFGLLEPSSGRFIYVNAGHNPPFHLGAGAARPLEEGGLILGIMPSLLPYRVGALELGEGESIVLYTDGVSEAMNQEREEYGEERLKTLMASVAGGSADELLVALTNDVAAFAAGAQQSDDITVVVLRRIDGG